uniref:Uncharacterized protein n=1 Tax=Arundo donax TaxID=35708 RepID=A0A0A9B253_ARUDO
MLFDLKFLYFQYNCFIPV